MPQLLFRLTFRLLVLAFVSAFSSGCFLYYTRIKPSSATAKPNSDVMQISLIEVGKSYYDYSDNSIDSEKLRKNLEKIRNFVNDPDARVQIRYSIETEWERNISSSSVLWFLTLGIYPMRAERETAVKFDLYDRLERRTLKSYSYSLKFVSFFGWVPMAFSPIAATSSTLGITQRISAEKEKIRSEEKIAENLKNDLLTDYENPAFQKILSSKERIARSTVAVLSFSGESGEKVTHSLASSLIEKRMHLVERSSAEIQKILNSQIFENSGIIANPTELGKLLKANILVSGNVEKIQGSGLKVNFAVHETQSGEILWKDSEDAYCSDKYCIDQIVKRISESIAAKVMTR
ncbi:hypothetical protein CH373_14915 [Leptospira perolatii]|uniref:Lipoprotein n=1 Tax=Leptospira perolatii TaxID=2023191 RepID=A0A2M9ZJL7_9LEPT|nr:hypothetical protein [Leptospira perolatii]PJZ68566.1 hypothetical protein CH360_15370 [Leptospira perolatii]PJZ72221.1 hypothetical protein CH373_14915 [Leptospira perolatii]